MTNDKKLFAENLRKYRGHPLLPYFEEAANHIEQLIAENERLREKLTQAEEEAACAKCRERGENLSLDGDGHLNSACERCKGCKQRSTAYVSWQKR